MKTFLAVLIAVLSFSYVLSARADNVVVKETTTWKSVPITVDTEKHTYTVTGTVPTDGDYYYSYSGYRCFREKRDFVGISVLTFNAGVAGGSDIYCYPET